MPICVASCQSLQTLVSPMTPNTFHYVAYSSNTIISTEDIYIHLSLWRHGVCIATRFPRKAALTGDAI